MNRIVTNSILAKLLAQENITVHIGKYTTAFFDVKNRILGLPTWNIDSKTISDLLIGHEVGHALWTPLGSFEEFARRCPGCPKSILNIVEDIRIERMIQDRYPGLISQFDNGYKELLDRDFFRIKDKDVSKLGFADRLNVKAKLRHLIDVDFSDQENDIFDRCKKAETIEDVIQICIDIHKMVKDQPKPETVNSNDEDDDESSDEEDPAPDVDEDSESDETEDEEESSSADDQLDDDGNAPPEEDFDDAEDERQSQNDDKEYGDVTDELESEMMKSFEQQLDDMHYDYGSTIPIIAPSSKHVDDSIRSVKDIMADRMSHGYYSHYINDGSVKNAWAEYKKSTKANIQYLITEFERKKAAYQYSRSAASDSGDIDTNKLHQYKFEEAIFRSVTKLADAKSHGMVFFIDYSQSMMLDINNVLEHTINLVMFCKAVSIPFAVYGFTTHSTATRMNYKDSVLTNQILLENTNVFELINSDLKKSEYDLALRQLHAQITLNMHTSVIDRPIMSAYENMVMTPLLEAIVIAHRIVDRFKKKHGVQKMNVLFLSDGMGQRFNFGQAKLSNGFDPHANGVKKLNLILNGRSANFENNVLDQYSQLINNLRITCDCTVIGFYISKMTTELLKQGVNAVRYSTDPIMPLMKATPAFDKLKAASKRENAIMITNGFLHDAYFLVDSNRIEIKDDDSFDPKFVTASPTAQEVSREFMKYNKNRRQSRFVLGKFSSAIA